MFQSGKPKRKSKPIQFLQSRGFTFIVGALTGIIVLLVGMMVLFAEVPQSQPTGTPTSFDTQVPLSAPDIATFTPAAPPTNPPCAWQWATEPQPDMTQAIQTQLDELVPGRVIADASAFGETCHSSGEGRFAAMQTDFKITLQGISPEDDEILFGETIDAVMAVLAQYPPKQTPGPNPGRITFIMEDTRPEWVTISYSLAIKFYDGDLRGMTLWQAIVAAGD